jgi:CheY-like chemotaxis protein
MISDPVFLYVEDDPISRKIMQMLLCNIMSYNRLILFEDSTDFIPRLEQLPAKPDVFLLDIHVHPHNGLSLLKMLRTHEQYKDASIVAVTASVMNEEVDELRLAGFNGGIAKPLDQTQFPNLIQRILNHESVWHIR